MSPYVLAFDTATDDIALALGERAAQQGRTRMLGEFDFRAPRAALGRLTPAILRALDAHSLTPSDISTVVVGRGPGSFTGVRIGVATAKGIAHGLDVPLYGIGTLDAVAWRATVHEGLLGVVGDAMRGEVYPAMFRLEAGRALRMTPDRVADPRHVAREWAVEYAGSRLMLAGNALRKYAAVFAEELGPRAAILPESEWHPGGLGVLRAFDDALARGDAGDGDPGALLPVYTRLSDAEEAERVRSGRPGATPSVTGVHGAEDDSVSAERGEP